MPEIKYIPLTRRKTAWSVGIYVTDVDLSFQNLSSQLMEIAAGKAVKGIKKIGSVLQFREEERRETTVQYELDADVPGEIVDVVPRIVTRTLTIQKAVLYPGATPRGTTSYSISSGASGDALDVNHGLGFTTAFRTRGTMSGAGLVGFDLMDQIAPLTIIRFELSPAKAEAGKENEQAYGNVVTVWRDCWITGAPKNFDIRGDMVVIQDVTIQPGAKEVYLFAPQTI